MRPTIALFPGLPFLLDKSILHRRPSGFGSTPHFRHHEGAPHHFGEPFFSEAPILTLTARVTGDDPDIAFAVDARCQHDERPKPLDVRQCRRCADVPHHFDFRGGGIDVLAAGPATFGRAHHEFRQWNDDATIYAKPTLVASVHFPPSQVAIAKRNAWAQS